MSSTLFVIGVIATGIFIYFYSNRKWQKHENEFNAYAMKMQQEFIEQTPQREAQVDYVKEVEAHYQSQGYSLSKHPDYGTDFIAKKDKTILFIRVQGPQQKQDITAQTFQVFVGQTALYALNNPLYNGYTIQWVYVCSKMMLDKSAKVYIKAHEQSLSFEQIAVEPKGSEAKEV